MPTYRKRAKNKRIYPEDPIYNNKSYRIDWKIIGKNIARRRVELNYTQQNLSDITGIPSVTISQFERNNYGKHPNPHQLVILMHALKMDANALYDGIKTLLDDPDLLSHYRKKALERGKQFSLDEQVRAIESLLSE